MRRFSIAIVSSLMFACALTARGADSPPVRLELDATAAPTGVLNSHMTFPAPPGVLTRAYPKWIPGEHSPSGPLSQIVRLTFTGGGVPLSWHRDDLDIFLFHVDVPKGVSEVRADLDFACVLGQEGFQSDICSSYDQLVVNCGWWCSTRRPCRTIAIRLSRASACPPDGNTIPRSRWRMSRRRTRCNSGLAADRGEKPAHLSPGRPVVRVDGDFRRIRREPRGPDRRGEALRAHGGGNRGGVRWAALLPLQSADLLG